MMIQHLLDHPSSDLVRACVGQEVDLGVLEPDNGLVGFLTERASTRTRASVAAAARKLGLGFIELPWGSLCPFGKRA